jgi:hypothetical protein
MKSWIIILLTLAPFIANGQSLDSTRLEFFPHHKGDIWQYRYRSIYSAIGYLETLMIVTDDTLLSNGRRYFAKANVMNPQWMNFFRVDSLQRVQSYSPYDSTERSVYRLGESDSAIWSIGKYPYLVLTEKVGLL